MDGKLVWSKHLETGISQVLDVFRHEKYLNSAWDEIEYGKTPGMILVKARLKMKTSDEGGRQTDFSSGLRPNHVFEYEDGELLSTWIGDIQFEDQGLIMPGEEKIVTIRFLFHAPIENYLEIGKKWWIHEGSRCTGEAEMLEIKLPIIIPKLH